MKNFKWGKFFFLVFLISFVASVCFANVNFFACNDVVTVPVRNGVTEKYIMTWDDSDSVTPTSAVILFAGDGGNVGISKQDSLIHMKALSGNFLVRSRRLFVDENIMSVVVDAPSDQSEGMGDSFRQSNAHANDLSKIIDDIKARFPGIKVYFVGTSRGTISATYAGNALQSKLDGIVLTSTVNFGGIDYFKFNSIKIPMLLVHHHDDGCPKSPYENAKSISKAYKIPIVTVYGGDPSASNPCEAFSAHGYLGKEQETVNEIKNWINHKPIQLKI